MLALVVVVLGLWCAILTGVLMAAWELEK